MRSTELSRKSQGDKCIDMQIRRDKDPNPMADLGFQILKELKTTP